MNFELREWAKCREQAAILGNHIQSYKDTLGFINLDKETLQGYVAHITCILKECSVYMDKCNLTMPHGLWKYDSKDPTTHPSSVVFKYKDRMSRQQIRAYGEGFMIKPLPEKKEAA